MEQSARAVCVLLAAGRSVRYGAPKALASFDGMTLIERALAATAPWTTIVVASPALAALLVQSATCTVIVNDAPERGMVHSFRLAEAHVPAADMIAVVPVDLPLLTAEHIRAVLDAAAGDVSYPGMRARDGHPVVLSQRARAAARALADGDRLRELKRHPGLSVNRLSLADEAYYADIDAPADLEKLSPQPSKRRPGISR